LSFPLSALADVIDAPALQSLMEDFYDLARIPMAIIDVEGRILVGAGWQDVCTRFHRVHPETCKACIESDTQLTAGLAPGECRLYRCKNHMWDVATPLMVRDRHMGNVFSGQFFFDDETIDYEAFRQQARTYGFDEEAYLAALDRAPRLSRERLDRGLVFFKNLAHMVSRLGDRNVTLARTIAERDALMQSGRERQADLNRAQAVARTGSWRLDVQRNVLSWSEEAHRVFGVPVGTPLSYESFIQAVHPDDRGTVNRAWQAALTGQPYDLDHRIVVGDVEKWVRERAELEFDENGQLLGGFGTVQDITERKRLEAELLEHVDQLAEANRVKDEFLSTLSHELRTPLNAVLGWSHLLLGGALDGDTRHRALEAIDRNARAQLRLVNDVLDVARIASGKLRLEPKDVDVGDCLHAALDAVRPAADAKQIAVVSSMAPGLVVPADADRLQQVFWNLLSNAVKFTPPGGRVEVALRQNGDHAEVTVRDTGIGIAPEFLPHVFQRFRQADGSTTRPHSGLGLGLAIVRHLVELHGGEVKGESGGLGHGATFTVLLRGAGRADGSGRSRRGRRRPRTVALRGRRVLVVDDQGDARDLLRVMLGELGAEVRTVATAQEGHAEVEAWGPDVIVCDIAMPGEDGYAFLRRVRALPADRGRDTPTVAVTANAGPRDRAKALAAGFTAYVPKPLDPEALATIVARLASETPAR
jgi:PAS domain S-box-containing protein